MNFLVKLFCLSNSMLAFEQTQKIRKMLDRTKNSFHDFQILFNKIIEQVPNNFANVFSTMLQLESCTNLLLWGAQNISPTK